MSDINIRDILLNNLDGIFIDDRRHLIIPNVPRRSMELLKQEFSRDLLDYQIPHNKVFAIEVCSGVSTNFIDAISPIYGCDKSYVEIANAFNDLIVPSIKGDLPSSDAESISIKCGCIKAIRDINTTSSFFYVGDGYQNYFNTLVRNQQICRFNNDEGYITALVTRSKGFVDYYANQKYLSNQNTYKPVRTVYDLTPYFLIKPKLSDEGNIQLIYKRDIDQTILLDIIISYFQHMICTGGE